MIGICRIPACHAFGHISRRGLCLKCQHESMKNGQKLTSSARIVQARCYIATYRRNNEHK